VTEDLPSQGSKLHPHAYKLPKATRIETPEGYIDYVDNGDSWQIKHTGTRPDMEGQGLAQQREVDMAKKAQEAGVTLNSDNEVNAGARRVYEKLIAKGKITADGPFDDGGPVYRNIRPAGGNVSDTLGSKPDIIGTNPELPKQWQGQAKKVQQTADEDAAYEANQQKVGQQQKAIVDLAKKVDAGDDSAVGALLDAIDASPSKYIDTIRAKAKAARAGGGKDAVGDLLKAIDYDIGLE
jgi:predicted GNAT family acetyltransferase